MTLRSLLALAACCSLMPAQDVPAQDPAAPQADAVPPVPEAHSKEARALVSQSIEKLVAYGRGVFQTTLSQNQAFMRGAGLPMGAMDIDLDGGWHRNTVWGDYDGREFVIANGRLLAKQDDAWRLRRSKLSGGVPVPFVLDPSYLALVLQQMSDKVGDPVHVEAGKLRGKRVLILTTKLDGDDALEFADSGAVPDVGGGMTGMVVMGGFGGLGMDPPRPELETYLAFWVNPEGGDLLRFAVKSYSTDQMMGQVQIAVQGGGGGQDEEEEEEPEAAADGKPVWKRGFPKIKPAKDQSVMTFRSDFKQLGLAKAPELDERCKVLLRVR